MRKNSKNHGQGKRRYIQANRREGIPLPETGRCVIDFTHTEQNNMAHIAYCGYENMSTEPGSMLLKVRVQEPDGDPGHSVFCLVA